MKVRLFGILSAVACLLCATAMSAQELPLLPQDPAIRSGVFPNGLSCYVAQNPSSKNLADFSLIIKNHDGKDLVTAQKNVIVSSEVAVDSMLISLMRRVDKDRTPADHAIVICGDVDADAVMMKLKYMSLMVDPSVASSMPEYVWNGKGKADISVRADSLKGLSTIRVQWQAPRAAFDKMNTIQSAVYEKLVWEFGEMASAVMKRSLYKQGIPYAEVSYSHKDCADGTIHDEFSFDVTVSQQDSAIAHKAIVSVLTALDHGKVQKNDLVLAERAYFGSLEKKAGEVISNEEYTRICRDAFLYNMPLSTDKERLEFFRSKDVSDESRMNMFCGVTSALLEMPASSDTLEPASSRVMLSDTLGLPGPSVVKMKIRSSRKDGFSGGTIWTFANGFKVIYHKMASTDRRLYYSLSLNGGYGNVDDLGTGQGSYFSDYLECCWVAGMKGGDFLDMLALAGMTLDTKVNLFNTVLSGHVEDRNAPLLMKSLLAVANESRADTAQMKYYAGCEKLRQSLLLGKDARATIDALMCPGYRYTSFKSPDGVHEGTFSKAETLFSTLFSKMNDGVLVIVGDMDEAELKKLLQMYVGDFKVRNVASRRPSVQYHAASGWSTCQVEGERDAVLVAMSAPFPMTALNHFATEMAVLMLERRLKAEFEPEGISVRVPYLRSIYPEERFSVMAELYGTAAQEDIVRLKDILSECLQNVSEEELAAYKGFVKAAYAQRVKTMEYWLKVISLRHLEGKDFTTGYAAKIDAVTVQMVRDVFKALEEGAGVEYITTKK